MLCGPYYQKWDRNLETNTAIGERYKLQLRGEVFHIANHPNFGGPNSAVSSPSSLDVLSSVVNETRTVAFAAKFSFSHAYA
jgi:hypothetical protein